MCIKSKLNIQELYPNFLSLHAIHCSNDRLELKYTIVSLYEFMELKWKIWLDPYAFKLHIFHIYLLQLVFSDSQLYVVISRVASRNGMKILRIDEEDDCIDTTSKVVYKEIF